MSEQGQKFDKNKPRMSLLPKGALNAVIRVLEFGANKYQVDNWKHVPDAKVRYYDAMQRHIDAWWHGEQKDPETGEHHLAHAICCGMFLWWFDNQQSGVPEAIANYRSNYAGAIHE
ncbi:dATP/dGTP diphosphohydrolase domain-containing protein [Acinetobacter sp. YH12108]|uniref:dATP/dGTP diphosphohydrolase domain-containing protein n=1 Tax=Acinetobacter sp. YH12108 TaxID=2601095 RepID=UPI00211EA93D|nr:dATP/dGTP diphosphohydrolase domain-containing protein [Acinetobacter sp. YH12108]